MKFDTPFTRMTGVRYPIMLGGIKGLGVAELAAAVSNAGGFGVVTAGCFTAESNPGEALRTEIRRMRDMTDKPFGVNISMNPGAGSDYGPLTNAFVKVVCEEGIVAVETSGRSPDGIVPVLHDNGVKVIHKSASARFAAKAAKVGADMVSCIGYESGGHSGNDLVASQIVLQRAMQLVDVPVLCAGSVVDGRGLMMALGMGCAGVVVGSRFLVSKESPAHQKYKEWIVAHRETDSVIIQRSIRNPIRAIDNELAREVAGFEALHPSPKIEEIMPLINGKRSDEAMARGDIERGLFSCGQGMGLIHDIPSVQEIVDSMVAGAEERCRELNAMLTL